MKFEEFVVTTNVLAFASRPKAKARQELYQFVKEDGLILNQELNPILRTQWQED